MRHSTGGGRSVRTSRYELGLVSAAGASLNQVGAGPTAPLRAFLGEVVHRPGSLGRVLAAISAMASKRGVVSERTLRRVRSAHSLHRAGLHHSRTEPAVSGKQSSALVEEPDILILEIAPSSLGVDVEAKAWSW